MLRRLLITAALVAPILLSPQAFAGVSEESAFLFADKKNWSDALAHAKQSDNKALETLIKWQYALDSESGAGFNEISDFINKNPDWPEQKRLKIRAEMSIDDSSVGSDEIIEWFKDYEPMTGAGKIALANALQQNGNASEEKIESLVRSAWVGGDFSESQEKSIDEKFGKFLRKDDDIARADRLLWEGKFSAAERMFKRVDEGREKLYKARIALQENKKDAPALLADVPAAERKDAGLLYDRMCYRAGNGDDEGVIEMLLAAPKQVPYPEKWWKYREKQIRSAMIDGDAKLAEKLLANHGQEEDGDSARGFAEACWLKGRLLLEYMNRPKDAYKIFDKMFSAVKYPVSKAKAAYWAGRAAKKAGDAQSADSWFNTAGSYPTTFYGQIASLVYRGTAPLYIPAAPSVDGNQRDEFNSRSIVKAAKLCIEYNEPELAEKLINHLIASADNDGEIFLASEIGIKKGKPQLSVRGAKKALQNNVTLLDTGYPLPETPKNDALPRELTLAITRQESEFNNTAKSPAGAIGMMQLMPATAKETARKIEVDFSPQRLHDPKYNMLLGSAYLQRMIDNYDGSLVMAIAAYNAGPGNVAKWRKKFGSPGDNVDDAIDWIENIPFPETQSYVQRVLENLQVYRHIEAQKSGDGDVKLRIGEDLTK